MDKFVDGAKISKWLGREETDLGDFVIKASAATSKYRCFRQAYFKYRDQRLLLRANQRCMVFQPCLKIVLTNLIGHHTSHLAILTRKCNENSTPLCRTTTNFPTYAINLSSVLRPNLTACRLLYHNTWGVTIEGGVQIFHLGSWRIVIENASALRCIDFHAIRYRVCISSFMRGFSP